MMGFRPILTSQTHPSFTLLLTTPVAVVSTGNVTISGLTGCPSAPYALLSHLSSGSLAAVSSVHVAASSSLPDFTAGERRAEKSRLQDVTFPHANFA